jgi:hypothetical protein
VRTTRQLPPRAQPGSILRLPARIFAIAVGVLAWIHGHDLAYDALGLVPDESAHAYLPVVEAVAVFAAVASLARFAWLLASRRADATDALSRAELCRLPLWTLPSGFAFVVAELAERSFTSAPIALLVVGAGIELVLAAVAFLASRRVLRTVVWAGARRTARRPRRDSSLAHAHRRTIFVAPVAPLSGTGGCRAPPVV